MYPDLASGLREYVELHVLWNEHPKWGVEILKVAAQTSILGEVHSSRSATNAVVVDDNP